MDDVLREILARAELKGTPTFGHDDVRRWPDGALDALVGIGILVEIDLADGVWIDCDDGCFVRPDVRVDPESGAVVGVHNCRRPGCGRLEIPIDQLRRWQMDSSATAKAVKAATGAKGRFVEAGRDRLWQLGHVVRDGIRFELFMARGLAWSDAATVLSFVELLRAAESPVVLVCARTAVAIAWPGRKPRFLALTDLAELRNRRLAIDHELLFAVPEAARGTGAVITVTEGAKMLLDIVDGITLEQARSRVSKAAGDGKFKTNGKTGAARRIDRDSFSTWLFEQRDKHLAAWR